MECDNGWIPWTALIFAIAALVLTPAVKIVRHLWPREGGKEWVGE